MFEFPVAAVVYCLILLALGCGLGAYYGRREAASFARGRRRSAFYCVRCDRVYEAPAGELASCPNCHRENPRLRF